MTRRSSVLENGPVGWAPWSFWKRSGVLKGIPSLRKCYNALGFSFRVQRCGGGLAAHGSLGWWVQEITVWRSAMGRQYRHLTLAEREDIMVHWKNRVGVSEIARLVGRDKSTVSREIRRNGWYSPVAGRMWCYRASTAHDKSQRRARRCRRPALVGRSPALGAGGPVDTGPALVPRADRGPHHDRAPRPGRERHNHPSGRSTAACWTTLSAGTRR